MAKHAHARGAHMVEDHVGAEAARVLAGMEEAVDHRQPVAQHVAQRAGDERAVAAGTLRYSMICVLTGVSSTIAT